MARDFDIRPGNTPAPTRLATPKSPKRSTRRGVVPLLIAIIGLAAAAIGAYYWSSLPVQPSSPVGETPASSNQEPAVTDKNVFSDQKLTVQIYQSGAPQETVDALIAKFKANSFTVENLGDSQFEYDKTYIWHTAEYADEAKALGALMPDRVISYKESQNAGLFDILIYLGKQ